MQFPTFVKNPNRNAYKKDWHKLHLRRGWDGGGGGGGQMINIFSNALAL